MAYRKFVLIAAVIIAFVKGRNVAVTAVPAPNEQSSLLEHLQSVGKQSSEEYSEVTKELKSNEAKAEYFVDRRKALKDRSKLWPNATVPYYVSRSLDRLSSKARKLIKDAIAHWEDHTCLRFVPYDPDLHKDFVRFQKGDGGCTSDVGHLGGEQEVNLGSYGCLVFGTVVHEIGHTIGWMHEHKRPDRDDHVKVNWKLIPEKNWHDYNKMNDKEIDTYGLPYDIGSIMHYESYNGKLEALDKSKAHLMGQEKSLSFYDMKLANLMYDCAERNHCNKKEVVCNDEGYVGPKCTCLCPDELESCSAKDEKRR